jgi:hypothetical protein
MHRPYPALSLRSGQRSWRLINQMASTAEIFALTYPALKGAWVQEAISLMSQRLPVRPVVARDVPWPRHQ